MVLHLSEHESPQKCQSLWGILVFKVIYRIDEKLQSFLVAPSLLPRVLSLCDCGSVAKTFVAVSCERA